MTHPPLDINTSIVSRGTATEAVDDFQIVSQDDPNRPAVFVAGDLYTFLATTRETNFNFNFFDFFLPVNGGPPPHIHVFENEVWHIIDGEIQYNLGNQALDTIVLPEGTTIFGPINRTHGFTNIDSTASISGVTPGARTLSITNPGLLEVFFSSAATRIAGSDRDNPIPDFDSSTGEGFINANRVAKIAGRTDGSVVFEETRIENYQAPEDALDYIVVLPENAEEEVVERALELSELDGFSIWTVGDHAGLPQRQTFKGAFGIEYISLVTFEETDGISYNQFFLESQENKTFDTFIQANLTGGQVVVPTQSPATGKVTLELNSEGDINYSLTVENLDFGELVEGGTPQTSDHEDDVTKIHIHSGQKGNNGSHVFNIFDPKEQHENDLSIIFNEDGSTTVSGTWNQTEKEIPTNLVNFISGDLPGSESDFYFQIHTERYDDGEIRGQIAQSINVEHFSDPIESDNHQIFYVKEGTLSVKIGDEVRFVGEDTFIYVAPGNEYSIANFGDETVESLSIAVIDKEVLTGEEKGLFPSPLNPTGSVLPNELVFLDDQANFFNYFSAQELESRHRIYGVETDDELFANREDRLFGQGGNDLLDASVGKGGNRLYGGEGNDEILVNFQDRAFGGDGDDLLDSSFGESKLDQDLIGHNLLDGGNGEDTLVAGSNDQLVGGNGDDILNIYQGDNNLLYGGVGADQFIIVNGSLPNTVEVEYPEDTEQFIVSGVSLAELVDTRNTIMDFELGVDKIHILGVENIASSFEDLELLPVFGDLGSTSIIAKFTEDGIGKEISLANVSGIILNELSADDFVFA